MVEYLKRDDALASSEILTVDTRDYGRINVVPVEYLADIPAADVKTEIHAYWIRGKEYGFKTHNPIWYCSNCGGSIRYDTSLRTYQKHKKSVEEVNCFCRKCGAKMDLPPIYERNKESEE